MAEPYIGEIGIFTYDFIPEGWLACEGQLLTIQQYQALNAVIGTKFGGDGITTFQLPDFRNRVMVHQGAEPGGTQRVIGSVGGSSSVTLTASEVPSHTHDVMCIGSPVSDQMAVTPGGGLWTNVNTKLYAPPDPTTLTPMDSKAIGTAGSATAAHENLQPYLVTVFCIATTGDYPDYPERPC